MATGTSNILRVSERRGTFTTEANFEKFICDTICKKQLDRKHFKVTGYKGIPDRFVFPNHFIEFKTNFIFKTYVALHKGWTPMQRQWAREVHEQDGRSWYCCLLQNQETFKKYVYLEPAVWSLWAHDRGQKYKLSTYEKHLLVVPVTDTERVKDHVWERLETDYYERSFERCDEEESAIKDNDAVQRYPNRLAP